MAEKYYNYNGLQVVASGNFVTGDYDISANSYRDFNVSFGKTLPNTPVVIMNNISPNTADTMAKVIGAPYGATTTGFTVRVANNTSGGKGFSGYWIAVC